MQRIVHNVRSVELGEQTRFEGGHLCVARSEVTSLCSDPSLATVRASWVSPGESARIVGPLDAVEPRAKGRGSAGGVFPGFVAPALPGGAGATHVLRGSAVVVAGFLPRAQEAVIEMSGEAAALSPLAATHNLVIEFEPAPDAPWEEVEAALRRGALRLAAHLADAALDAEPDAIEELPGLAAPDPGGPPRAALVVNLQTQGAFKDVFVYGRSMAGALPTLIEPGELEDGAVVSGQYGHPGLKNPTYLHQNNPVIAALRARSDVALGALILCPEPVDQATKELVSAHAARLCRACGVDFAIVTKEGGGNADSDMALKMDMIEDLGMPAVGLFAEMSGPDGTGAPLVAPPARATAMVSTGNYDERIALERVERALGRERIALADADATAALELPTAVIYAALSPLGWGRLTCRELGQCA